MIIAHESHALMEGVNFGDRNCRRSQSIANRFRVSAHCSPLSRAVEFNAANKITRDGRSKFKHTSDETCHKSRVNFSNGTCQFWGSKSVDENWVPSEQRC